MNTLHLLRGCASIAILTTLASACPDDTESGDPITDISAEVGEDAIGGDAALDTTTTDAALEDVPSDAAADSTEDAEPASPLSWFDCGRKRMECGRLVVPVDHANPTGPTMQLPLVRWPALSAADRIGALIFGPGGPGEAGTAGPDAIRNMPAAGELLRRFDIIGMDLRGTGGSVPAIDCVSDAEIAELLQQLDAATDDATLDALIDTFIQGCRDETGADVLAHLGTTNAARDIDLLRETMGDDKISLFGASYGTWLTTVYAVLFPERIRAGLLAASLPATNDAFERLELNLAATEKALGAFFLWCDETEECAFRPNTPTTTREAFDALAASVIASPVVSSDGLAMMGPVGMAGGVTALLYGPNYGALGAALGAARDGDPMPLLSSMLAATIDYPEALVVIRSLDDVLPEGATLETWKARAEQIRLDGGSIGALLTDYELLARLALRWTDRTDETFEVAPIPTAPPLLVVSNQLDPTLAGAGSQLPAALGNGSVELVTSRLGHFVTRDPCGMERGTAYLVDPSSIEGGDAVQYCPDDPTDYAVIGTVSEAFAWSGSLHRTQEAPLGNLICDAMRESSGAPIAVINGGGIRRGLPASNIFPADKTLRRPSVGYASGPPWDVVAEDVRAILPFGNKIVVRATTGEELWAFVEHAVSEYTSPTNGTRPFLQVSGIRITFDPSSPAGQRVQTLTLDDDTPIAADDSTSYDVAMVDYVWYGGSDWFRWAESEQPLQAGETVDAALSAYIKEHSLNAGPAADLVPSTDGRVTAL